MTKTKEMIKVFITKEDLEKLNEIEDIITYGENETVVMDVEPWRVIIIIGLIMLFALLFFVLMAYMIMVFPYGEVFNP